jgi:hypothetical protein
MSMSTPMDGGTLVLLGRAAEAASLAGPRLPHVGLLHEDKTS